MLFKRISRHIAKNQFGNFLKPFFQTKLLENECKLVTLYALSYRTYINLIATFITDTFRHERFRPSVFSKQKSMSLSARVN